MKPRILLSIGDPNGIGPEIAVRSVAAIQERRKGPPPVLVGDPLVVDHYARHLGMIVRETIGTAEPAPNVVDLLPVRAIKPMEFCPGKVSAAAGRATIEYVLTALKAVNRGYGNAIVAAPHSETAISQAGIPFTGYPSLLANSSENRSEVFLMLTTGNLRITHATLHCSLRSALGELKPRLIKSAVQATHNALVRFGIEKPRIGVFGINPHAGEEGLFGNEDTQIIKPVVEELLDQGYILDGPKGCDVLLASRDDYDGFVAMYHDQGHAPIKAVGGRNSNALCIGNDIMFSSVGHGAAFDIAGQFKSDISPLLGAIDFISAQEVSPLNSREEEHV